MTVMYKTRTATPRLRPGPGGLPRGQVTQIQRSRMLAAAVEAVEEVGYAHMTVAQVISRARVSRKTFYDVFTDREDCFLAAFEQALSQAALIATEAYEGRPAGARASVRRWRGCWCSWTKSPGSQSCASSRRSEPASACSTAARRCSTNWREVIDRGRAATNATREPPEVTAEGVVGAIFAVLHTRVLEQRPGAARRSARLADEHDRAPVSRSAGRGQRTEHGRRWSCRATCARARWAGTRTRWKA